MDHIERFNKVIEYIEANLDKDIHLNFLASGFALSKYHFHRIFKALIGDPPARYIQKRRLSRAADDLIHTNKRIVDIAFDYGFNSHESFIRSFKTQYFLTPSRFRTEKPDFSYYEKCRISIIELNLSGGKVKLRPKIERKPDFSIAGLPYYGSDTKKIHSLWQQFWLMVQTGTIDLDKSGCRGVCLHDLDMRNNEIFIYYAGIEVKPEDRIPQNFKTVSIPESTFAVFTHKGPTAEIEQTYDRIYGSWIPGSGNTPTMDLDILVVNERFKDQDENSEVDIWIPIQNQRPPA